VTALQKSELETFRNQRKDGTIFWNQINTSFHTAESGTQYAVSVCRNVTQSIEHEKQLEATSRELARRTITSPGSLIAQPLQLT
jgi:hypothetical protein